MILVLKENCKENLERGKLALQHAAIECCYHSPSYHHNKDYCWRSFLKAKVLTAYRVIR